MKRFCIIIFFAANFCFAQLSTPVYIDNEKKLQFTSSNLPIFVINTNGQNIIDDDKITVDLGVIYNGEGVRNNVTDSFNHYDGKIGIEIRGSSSQMFPKKQYGVETRDADGEDLDVSLLGMPAESDWIFYAPYSDKSLMRNVLAYDLAREMGRYATRSKYFELVLNGDYKGVYVLFEKIKRDKNRVNIKKLEPDDVSGDALTGGYIIKIDKWTGTNNDGWNSNFPPYFNAWQSISYQYHIPKPEDIVWQQKNYIQNYIYTFEKKMYSSGFDDPDTGYVNNIDIQSFADFFLINEISKNVDGYRLSTFMYKDRNSVNSKLFMGPIWDYNLAFGNADYYNGWLKEGWQLEYLSNDSGFLSSDGAVVPFWWKKLMEDTLFANTVRMKWEKYKNSLFSMNSFNSKIDSLIGILNESQQRNFVRWTVLGQYVWPNAYIGQTYANEMMYLKTWIRDRLIWLDDYMIGNIVSVAEDININPNNFELYQNYPNPFNPNTKIKFTIPSGNTFTSLVVYDLLGNKVADLVDGELASGSYEISFDGTKLSSGVYFYTLRFGDKSLSKKMLLIK